MCSPAVGERGCLVPELVKRQIMYPQDTIQTQHTRQWTAYLLLLFLVFASYTSRDGLYGEQPAVGLFQQARDAFYSGNMARARELIESHLRVSPRHREARVLLARVLAALGKNWESYEELRKLLVENPQDLDALFYLASVATALSQLEYTLTAGVQPALPACSRFGPSSHADGKFLPGAADVSGSRTRIHNSPEGGSEAGGSRSRPGRRQTGDRRSGTGGQLLSRGARDRLPRLPAPIGQSMAWASAPVLERIPRSPSTISGKPSNWRPVMHRHTWHLAPLCPGRADTAKLSSRY